MAGGRVGVGTRSRTAINVDIRVEGVDRTTREFRDARRDFNKAIRDVMHRVGTREVLPDVKAAFPSSRFAATLGIQRERSGVFVKSSARGTLNRAVGWLDFGGKRPLDTQRREGPYTIVRALDRKRDRIDEAVLEELLDAFDPLDHTP